ncbi:uncharacterized protein LOC135368353 [Ornithodoros turicata]|uniref:uncharacterized protein LOC135368353 n=1 Tax=Ornithodoros turicata TaxID=34597 RepID=UPI003139EECD
MKPVITKMKLPDFTGPVCRTKPWVPPPGKTSRDDKDATKAKKPAGTAGVVRQEYSRRFTVPLLEFPAMTVDEGHFGFLERICNPPGAMSSFPLESEKRDTSTWTEMRNCEAETQTDSRVPPFQYCDPDALKLPEKIELHKLSQVVQHLEDECSGFREALSEKNDLLVRAQEELGIFLGHLHALRTTLLLAENCSAVSSFMWKEEENVPAKIKDLKVNASKVRQAISTLLDKEDHGSSVSDELPRVWGLLTRVLARLESDLWESCKDHLTTHLRRDIESKEEEIAQLRKDVEYYMKREEGEKERQDRCLDLIQELQKKCHGEKKSLRKGVESWESNAAKYEETIQSLSRELNDKDRKLHEATSESESLRASIEKMHLERIDVERALINMKSKVADLEPLILNPTANVQAQRLMNELGEHKDEIRFLRKKLQEVSQQKGFSTVGLNALLCDMNLLQETLHKSRDPKTRQLVSLLDKLKQQVSQLAGGHWDLHAASLNGQSFEPAFVFDREKERLSAKVEELQGELDHMAASNRNLTSYIATLRKSYAAVFCESLQTSSQPSRVTEEGHASH